MDPVSEWLWPSLFYLSFTAVLYLLGQIYIYDPPKWMTRNCRRRSTTDETDED